MLIFSLANLYLPTPHEQGAQVEYMFAGVKMESALSRFEKPTFFRAYSLIQAQFGGPNSWPARPQVPTPVHPSRSGQARALRFGVSAEEWTVRGQFSRALA